jgi:alpha-N-arabinofuranosidase
MTRLTLAMSLALSELGMRLPLAWRRSFAAVSAAALYALALPVAASTGTQEYRNPVIRGFHPDPSICRNGDDYYLATSTFEYFPGVPIFHSKDLINWRKIGHALTRTSQLNLDGRKSSKGIFAPTLRCGNGQFYMITTDMEGAGNFIVHTRDPAGPWSEPIKVQEPSFHMDPSLLFDDDGKVYYTRHEGNERGGIVQAEIDVATGQLKGELKRIWNGTGGVWPEGPHLYKINGWYYLLIAEGGTSYDHTVTMARAKTPWGPFEAAPNNPVFTHRDRPDLPLQATGHADLVQTPEGRWFMVMLGIRPVGRDHHLGRETLLAPVEWTGDGWLKVNGGAPLSESMRVAGLPPRHPWPKAPVRDDFDARTLGLEWTFVRGPGEGLYSLTAKPGTLRLKGNQVSLSEIGTPAFIGRRQTELHARAATLLDFAPTSAEQSAGLALRMNEDHHYQLLVSGSGKGRTIRLLTRVKGETAVLREAPIGAGEVKLAVRAYPDRYVFAYRVGNGKAVDVFGQAPTQPLSSENAGGFTGVFIGMVAHGAGGAAMPPADFEWFDYEPLGGAGAKPAR